VFKSEIMPGIIEKTKGNLERVWIKI
jgi:hypothetical protein